MKGEIGDALVRHHRGEGRFGERRAGIRRRNAGVGCDCCHEDQAEHGDGPADQAAGPVGLLGDGLHVAHSVDPRRCGRDAAAELAVLRDSVPWAV